MDLMHPKGLLLARNTVPLQQPATFPGILAQNQIHSVQYSEGSDGNIFQIADGRGYYI